MSTRKYHSRLNYDPGNSPKALAKRLAPKFLASFKNPPQTAHTVPPKEPSCFLTGSKPTTVMSCIVCATTTSDYEVRSQRLRAEVAAGTDPDPRRIFAERLAPLRAEYEKTLAEHPNHRSFS